MRDEHCYLTDFGLTKRTSSATSLTATGQFVGTAQYMAPEQILGEPLDGRADLYALGCILFHCLTGAPPFERENSVAVIYAHLSEPPPAASAARPDVPAALDEVIARAMAKAPTIATRHARRSPTRRAQRSPSPRARRAFRWPRARRGGAVALGVVWVVRSGDDSVGRLDGDGQALGTATKVGHGPPPTPPAHGSPTAATAP